jgi:uncharacterized protein YbjT (DUF2867 family)
VKRIVKLSGKIAEHHSVGFSKWNREAEQKIRQSGIPYTRTASTGMSDRIPISSELL